MGNTQPGVKPYCLPLAGSKKDGQTEIYRHPSSMGELQVGYEGMNTLQDIWVRNFKECPNQEFLGERPLVNGILADHFVYKTFDEVRMNCEALGSGIENLN